MEPVAVVEAAVGGAEANRAQSEQRPEGHGAVETPVEAEHELVQIGLEVLLADAVEGPIEPSLEVGGDGADQRQPRVHAGPVAEHGQRLVTVAAGCQALELAAVVGPDNGTGCNALFGKLLDSGGGLVGNLSKSDASCQRAFDDLARLRVALLRAWDLDGNNHRHLMGSTRAAALVLAAGAATAADAVIKNHIPPA